MQSAWNEREAEAAVARDAERGIARELALRLYSTRLLGRDPRLVLHGGGNTSLKAKRARPDRRRGRRALRQGLRLPTWARSSPPDCRRCGSTPLRALARARGACPTTRWRGCSALTSRSARALAVGRDAAARLHAGAVRRPHPCDRGAEPDRPAERASAVRRGLWRAPRLRALPHAGLRPRQDSGRSVRQKSEGRRPDPRQARHLHLRRRARARPTSA